MSKYHEPRVFMNIYEVPLTIKVNPMWYFIHHVVLRRARQLPRVQVGDHHVVLCGARQQPRVQVGHYQTIMFTSVYHFNFFSNIFIYIFSN